MYYCINNSYYDNILILFILLVFSIFGNYIIEFLDFKKFVKKYYDIDIKFLSFTYNLILKKIKDINTIIEEV